MGTLLGFVVAMRSRIGSVGPALVSPPLHGERVSASIMASRRLSMGAGGHGRRQSRQPEPGRTLYLSTTGGILEPTLNAPSWTEAPRDPGGGVDTLLRPGT